MQYQGMNLCDFCFTQIAEGVGVCPHCGLSHETYRLEAGLLPPGTNLNGKYIIGRLLGRGGFGATYLAYSSERNSVVAIKEYFPTGIATRAKDEERVSVLSPDKQDVYKKGASKMYEEAKTIFKFKACKNIVSVYEFFYANSTVYFSMEYLDGIDLKNYITKKGGRLTEQEVVAIVKGVCEALMTVHSAQILHRDISPDNIFICTNGEIKLIDFGSAKQVVSEEAKRNYSVVVKQGFAPAEQYTSKGKQGVWTDLYAVGATMYYALTGHVPPDAMSRVDNPNINIDPAYGITPGLVRIIDRCLRVKIEERYQSAVELFNDINALGTGIITVGGREYVNPVYNYNSVVDLQGQNISFMQPDPGPVNQQTEGYNPLAGQIPNSQSQVMTSNQSYYPASNLVIAAEKKKSESNGMFKGIMIGLAILAVVLIAIIAVLMITGNGDNDNSDQQQGMNYQPVPGGYPPPPPPPGPYGVPGPPPGPYGVPGGPPPGGMPNQPGNRGGHAS
ncbi:MAG: serine/threonine protein kinase [Ruminococcaceae bacterium]|nr:serine/threonine protein kinase [Oscillospiraceae bacterium]